MVRLYKKNSVKGQLDKLSHHIQEFYPGHYAEHLQQIQFGKGIGDRAIMILVEQQMKVSALGKALLEVERQLKEKMDSEAAEAFPEVPFIGADGIENG